MLRATLFSRALLMAAIGWFVASSPGQAQHHGGGGHSSGGHSSGGHGGGGRSFSSGGHSSAGHAAAPSFSSHAAPAHNFAGHATSGHWAGGNTWHGGNGNGHNYSGYGRNYYGYDHGYGRYGYGRYGYGDYGYPYFGLGYSPYVFAPSYYYDAYSSAPSYYYDDSSAAPGSSYVTPSYGAPPEQAAAPTVVEPASADQARLDVIVPDPSAQVFVQGQRTSSTGRMRYFVSPRLTPGSMYSYTLTCVWDRGGRTATDERTVQISAGATTVVDFTRPVSAANVTRSNQ